MLERREALYSITKRLGAQNRNQVLKPYEGGGGGVEGSSLLYRIDPATRYVRAPT